MDEFEMKSAYAYSENRKGMERSRLLSNPLTNSFNTVESIVNNINLHVELPPLYNLPYIKTDLEAVESDKRVDVVVSYPPCPSFLPEMGDIDVFNMLVGEMESSMKKDTDELLSETIEDTFNQQYSNGQEYSLSDEEKRLCEVKLHRMEYERKRREQDATNDKNEEHEDTAISDTDCMDVKCVNDCLSSHFRDILTPHSLQTAETNTPPVNRYAQRFGRDQRMPQLSVSSNEPSLLLVQHENIMEPYLQLLKENILQNEGPLIARVDEPPFQTKQTMKLSPPLRSNALQTLYHDVKDAMRKKEVMYLPRIISLTPTDTAALPHRRRASSSASSASTESSDRPLSSLSASTTSVSVDSNGDVMKLLQDLTRLDDNPDRANEACRLTEEYGRQQVSVRQQRHAIDATELQNCWQNALNLVSHLDEVTYRLTSNFGNYRPIISLRISFDTHRRSLSLDGFDAVASSDMHTRAVSLTSVLQEIPSPCDVISPSETSSVPSPFVARPTPHQSTVTPSPTETTLLVSPTTIKQPVLRTTALTNAAISINHIAPVGPSPVTRTPAITSTTATVRDTQTTASVVDQLNPTVGADSRSGADSLPNPSSSHLNSTQNFPLPESIKLLPPPPAKLRINRDRIAAAAKSVPNVQELSMNDVLKHAAENNRSTVTVRDKLSAIESTITADSDRDSLLPMEIQVSSVQPEESPESQPIKPIPIASIPAGRTLVASNTLQRSRMMNRSVEQIIEEDEELEKRTLPGSSSSDLMRVSSVMKELEVEAKTDETVNVGDSISVGIDDLAATLSPDLLEQLDQDFECL